MEREHTQFGLFAVAGFPRLALRDPARDDDLTQKGLRAPG